MKIGIVYGTNREEATVRIVEWMQEALEENGASVVSGKHENFDDFDFDKIIVGSAVYGFGIIMTGIDKFLIENRKSLAEKPLSAFIVCGPRLFLQKVRCKAASSLKLLSRPLSIQRIICRNY